MMKKQTMKELKIEISMYFQMVLNTQVNGKVKTDMVMGYVYIKMELNTKDVGKMINKVDMGLLYIQTEIVMLVNGIKIWLMVKVST